MDKDKLLPALRAVGRKSILAVQSRGSIRLLLAFAALIFLGTLFLVLAPCMIQPEKARVLDLLFTATSAVCVTGLTVLDTEKDFNWIGQLGILALIQLGGLGLLTLTNWMLLSIRHQRLGFNARLLIEQTHGRLPAMPPLKFLRQILLFTAVWELTGALLLYARFVEEMEAPRAAWQAVFHSISAFCNAGFSLFSDSLTRYREDPAVNLIIMVLIVAGGLGFTVFSDLGRWTFRTERRQLSLHSRLALWATATLILLGALLICLFEWNHTLKEMPPLKKITAALFLSVTSRTAGFNTIDTGSLSCASLLVLLVWMLIGASPGSTGGGVKTTTFMVVLAVLRARIKSRASVEIFHRRLPEDIVSKSLATILVFAAICGFSCLLIVEFETSTIRGFADRSRFLDYLFETVSAVCTVGLSANLTPTLASSSRCVIIACMFIGRLGPLLISDSLVGTHREIPYRYPEERVMIG